MRHGIAVLDYGMGNLLSVSRAVSHVGGAAQIVSEASDVDVAAGLVIPGVGHFGACMRAIEASGLDAAIRSFVASGRPVFGICLGMQILLEGSEEDDATGLGFIAGRSRKLPGDVKVPHMGWNEVTWTEPHPFVEGFPDGERFYFVHSFAPDVLPSATVGTTTYGRLFSSAVATDNVFATQFHPEKSGEAGLAIYERFVKAVANR